MSQRTQVPQGPGASDVAGSEALLRELVDRGWRPPEDPAPVVRSPTGAAADESGWPASLPQLDQAAVRSLVEDLAVARLRATTAREVAGRTYDRVADAVQVSHELQAQTARHRARAAHELGRLDQGLDRRGDPAGPVGATSSTALARSASGLETTAAVVDWALTRIPAATGTDEAAVRLDGPGWHCVPGGLADRVEHLQGELGEGPSLDAATGTGTVLADTTRTTPWSRWAPAAAHAGAGGALAVPLVPGGAPGVLTLYTAAPARVGADQVQAAESAAALLALAHARRTAQLHEALTTRTVIGQAQGLLMERLGVDADGAFAILRRLSSGAHRRLSQVAADLVQNRVLPPTG